MPFYIPAEQQARDKADFARKGIARGRSVVAVTYTDGLLFVADNPSTTLNKLSEIYDRIAFAAVGKYSEFEQLRRYGIRNAEVTGYQYAREDVTGRSLANAYASALGQAFAEGQKPFEVELLVAEVGESEVETEVYHILYDGSITDEHGFVVVGGSAEAVNTKLKDSYTEGLSLAEALTVSQQALSTNGDIEAVNLEVAGLDRTRGRRKFFRLPDARVAELLGQTA